MDTENDIKEFGFRHIPINIVYNVWWLTDLLGRLSHMLVANRYFCPIHLIISLEKFLLKSSIHNESSSDL